MTVIKAPTCPRCDAEPTMVVGDRQAFCGTDGCRVFTWNMTDDRAAFEANHQIIDLGIERTDQAGHE